MPPLDQKLHQKSISVLDHCCIPRLYYCLSIALRKYQFLKRSLKKGGMDGEGSKESKKKKKMHEASLSIF